jgi:hypothetical protein
MLQLRHWQQDSVHIIDAVPIARRSEAKRSASATPGYGVPIEVPRPFPTPTQS